ncbi:hypothetical protein C7W88_09955 [Novosphingobium sp. THN1]|uniref:hypothetical protein n=1 Tax=unclassified Novosphingobium TaxID=2644732 RepID=UPI000E4BDDC4|nr:MULTISPECIES: hypothetical protein [unclassified Novosphingobium]AXU19283.1 hypothetical protein C7W88_09955 [Novosphingobium sp. THN1]MBA4088739.1 hypothetical protein [Novosphingobium sp.]NLR38995.1 hypothetical protein [Novosphingobium sp. ERW19]
MGPGSTIVAVIAIIAFVIIRTNRDRYRAGIMQQPPIDPAYTASLEREVSDLRKRLEVLERIATDEGETRRLSREIESLRDR